MLALDIGKAIRAFDAKQHRSFLPVYARLTATYESEPVMRPTRAVLARSGICVVIAAKGSLETGANIREIVLGFAKNVTRHADADVAADVEPAPIIWSRDRGRCLEYRR